MKLAELQESSDDLLKRATAFTLRKLQHDFEGLNVNFKKEPIPDEVRDKIGMPADTRYWITMGPTHTVATKSYLASKLRSYFMPGALPFMAHTVDLRDGPIHIYLTQTLEEGNMMVAHKISQRIDDELKEMATEYQKALQDSAEPGVVAPKPFKHSVAPMGSGGHTTGYVIDVFADLNVTGEMFAEIWEHIERMMKDEGFIGGVYPVDIFHSRMGTSGNILIR